MQSHRIQLFTPGPVMLHPRVKAALMHAEIPHRRGAFETLFKSTQDRMRRLLGLTANDDVVFLTGSGSAANECAITSLLRPGEEVVLVSNGPFGDRLSGIMTAYNIGHTVVGGTWGAPVDLHAVERALTQHPNAAWVAVVWHETGSGMRNPVRAVGELAHRLGRKVLVDGVSAFGAEDMDMGRDHMDVLTTVSNKAVGGITGLSVVVARAGVVPPRAEVPTRNVYLSLQNHVQWAREHHQTPNTPAVTALYAMDAALAVFEEQGVAARVAHVQACSRVVRNGVRALGWSLLLPPDQSVDALTSVCLPGHLDLDTFIDRLEARGFAVYPGKGPFLHRNVFQVAVMGALTQADCAHLVIALGEVAAALGSRQAA